MTVTTSHDRIRGWKLAVEKLWAADDLDAREAARVVAEMREHAQADLRDAAGQAMPSLRNAAVRNADRRTRDLARRRLGVVLNELRILAAPRFGRRRSPHDTMTLDEVHRHMLGLPLGGRLSKPDIQQAYKQAAKSTHPDGGGSEQAFLELTAARDALIRLN